MSVAFPVRTDGIVLRHPVGSDTDAVIARGEQAFSEQFTDEDRVRFRERFVPERYVAAFDGDDLVGFAGSYDFELTVPGGGQLDVAGVTAVSVAPTHRRRGLLRDMLDWVHDDAIERGRAGAVLLASEGAIYERFGYGIATTGRRVEIDLQSARLRSDVASADGRTRMVDAKTPEAAAAMFERFDRFRRNSVGEVSRSEMWIRHGVAGIKHPFLALHDDGYALWTINDDWDQWDANHTLGLVDLVACTPEAHRDLWALVLSIDLVRRVRSRRQVRLDDALPWLLENPRVVKTIELHDFSWVLPFDIARLLSCRRYRIEGEVVIEVEGSRWRVAGGPTSASCEPTDAEPDVTMTRSALGSIVLGGISATELAAGGRLQAAANMLPHLDAFLGWAPLAHCSTEF